MAVELRCPDCRAKLRLKAAPEAGTEVECPKCATVFPAPEPESEGDEDAPKKKKKVSEDEEEEADGKKEKKDKKQKKTKTKKDGEPKGPRKRRAKKRETSKAALIAVVATGLLMLSAVTGGLIWFFTRTSKSVEMLYYAPEDAQMAMGVNIGHAQKYPEFYKSLKNSFETHDFKQIGEGIAKAADSDFDSLFDYVVKAESVSNGWSIAYRTKLEFDDGALTKLPSGEKKSLDGKAYYVVPNLSNQRLRVFSPTNRLVVACPDSLSEPVFRKMINGHGESKEGTLGVRMGPLGKRVTRGTFWQMGLFDKDLPRPVAPTLIPGANVSDEDAFRVVVADALGGAKGYGVKASLGSREVRFELIGWANDAEKASNFTKKMKEGDLGKGDEVEPPRWFRNKTQALGDKKVAAQLLANLGFGASGELLYTKSAVETADLKQSAGTAINKVLGMEKRQDSAMPNPAGPGGAPNPQPPGQPKMPRRRKWVRR